VSAETALVLVALSVAVAATVAAGVVLKALLDTHRAHNTFIEWLEKMHRDERTSLVNRIQRPDVVPPTPERIQADHEQAQRMQRLRAELRSVGTVTHTPEKPGDSE